MLILAFEQVGNRARTRSTPFFQQWAIFAFLAHCVCTIQYNGSSAFNFYCYEVGRLSEIESVELAKNFMMRDFW